MDIFTVFAVVIGTIASIVTILPFFGISSYDKLPLYKYIRHQPQKYESNPRTTTPSHVNNNHDISRLPRPSMGELIGRSEELEQLTGALNSNKTCLVYICAGGGVGKSALTFSWLQQMQPDYLNVDKVFAWSFYSQGSHDTQTSSIPFFQVALPFFGFTGELPKTDVEKGQELGKCLNDKTFILVLDGLEPLQHPERILSGELKDGAIEALLHYVVCNGLKKSPSLILISSRQRLVESETWLPERYKFIDLQTLSNTDGAQLLKTLNVNGTEEELKKASNEMGGHALALVLLGKLLQKKFSGDIAQRDQLPHLWEENERLAKHTHRILQFYDNKLWQKSVWQRWWHGEMPEQVFMYLLGLFDRPMTWHEKNILVERVESYTAPLRNLNDVEQRHLEKTLEDAGLLLQSESYMEWDCHPLIRDYFGQRFLHTHKREYLQAQQVLFEFYQKEPAKHQPDTLKELEPLYRAVVHGCLAEKYESALSEVYQERILRGNEHYSQNKLGAYSQDLTALSAFFPHGWSKPVSHRLSEANQALLLDEASFCLMSLGRLQESVEPRKMSLRIWVKLQRWRDASRSAQNLIDLYLPLGQLTEAEKISSQALEYAKKGNDLFGQVKSHSYLATTLHRQGQLKRAMQSFQRAEQLQQQDDSKPPQLYAFRGFRYCTLLLDQAQSEADYNAVLQRGEYALQIAEESGNLLDIALNNLTLARVYTQLQDYSNATTYFDKSVKGVREASKTDRTPPFLISRANFLLTQNRAANALLDLQRAERIIHRGGMKLYEVDWRLAMCRYYLAQQQLPDAQNHLESAIKLIKETNYHLRDGAVNVLQKVL